MNTENAWHKNDLNDMFEYTNDRRVTIPSAMMRVGEKCGLTLEARNRAVRSVF